jgi:hypothetical protein
MRRSTPTSVISQILAISSLLMLNSCGKKIKEGMVIFTRVQENISEVVAIDPRKSWKPAVVISGDFWSAREPDLSSDGRYLVFSGKKSADESWSIWKTDLYTLKQEQLFRSTSDCHFPVWLPGNRIIFTLDSGINNSLHIYYPDRKFTEQLTFDPAFYGNSSVIMDGRLLTLRTAVESLSGENTMMAVLRPDGTKKGIFYKPAYGSFIRNTPHETIDGKIIFIESPDSLPGGNVISIDYNRPLHSEKVLSNGVKGRFSDAWPLKSGLILVSYISTATRTFSLCLFDPSAGNIIQTLYEDREYEILNPIMVESRHRPKKLPSEVDKGVSTGLLLCQDVSFSGFSDAIATVRPEIIELIGRDSSMGKVRVEKDGSFYLRISADTPFRIRTLDSKGQTNKGPSAWIYLRPNERRGCTGCHEDPELVPENRIPLAVKKQPVSIPVNVNLIKEKEIDLE